MSYIVEATSFSSLISTASDPPLDPRGDIRRPPEPLVLYIARVPGSKDVFLTPIKPREKVVSAEDIHSSLYYLHAHGPDDRKLSSPGHEQQTFEGRRWSETTSTQLHAPPLPPRNRYVQSEEALTFSDPFKPPSERPWNRYSREERARSLSPAHRLGYQNGVNRPQKAIRRKPVGQGPTPLTIRPSHPAIFNSQAGIHSRYSPPKSPHSDSLPYPVNETFPDVDKWRPRKPSRMPYESDLFYGGAVQSMNAPSLSAMDVQPKLTPPTTPGLPMGWFTLIRRDPATGKQWNVAKLHNGSKSHPYEQGRPMPCLDITIETPGYAKFVNSRKGSEVEWSTSSLNLDKTNGANQLFQRELFIENLQEAIAPPHTRSKSDDASNFQDLSVRPPNHSRLSIPSSTSTVNLSSSRYNLANIPRAKRRTGLKFMSPWNGVCEFSTTVSNSLKCKHVLGPSLLSSEPSLPVAVSELRFNLPSSNTPELKTYHSNSASIHLPMPDEVPTHIVTPPSASMSLPKRSRLFFAKIKNRSSNPFKRRESEPILSTSSISPALPSGQTVTITNGQSTKPTAVGRSVLDLSLGQEYAGGGSSGTQAKMGKLIIEPEGMKMLDLVVAANLGLWWRAYDKDYLAL